MVCGLDTVSIGYPTPPAWYDEQEWRRQRVSRGYLWPDDADAPAPVARVVPSAAGLLRVMPLDADEWPGGMTLGVFSRNGLAVVEGRASAIVSEDTDNHALARPAALLEVEAKAARILRRLDLVDLESRHRSYVRRLDLASEVVWPTAADGLSFLDALSRVDMPRLKTDVWRNRGRVETVYLRTPKRGAVRARAYDKGVEAGTHRPGERVRLERQVRWTSSEGPPMDRELSLDLGALFVKPLGGFLRATDGVQVLGIDAAVEALLEMVAADRLAPLRAERLVGTLAIAGRVGTDSGFWSDRTAVRRRADLRSLGIDLDTDPAARARAVPVGDVVGAMVEAWRTKRLALGA